MKRGRLIRVKSASELRVGMIVVVKGCLRCGGRHTHVLLGAEPAEECAGCGTGCGPGWVTSLGSCRGYRGCGPGWVTSLGSCRGYRLMCFAQVICDGRLYRRADDFEGEKKAQAQGRRDANAKQREGAR